MWNKQEGGSDPRIPSMVTSVYFAPYHPHDAPPDNKTGAQESLGICQVLRFRQWRGVVHFVFKALEFEIVLSIS